MRPEELKLAAQMLEEASDQFSNHGCNDWEWPVAWTREQRRAFLASCDMEDEERSDYLKGKYGPPDWLVMSALSAKLKELADAQ